MCEEKLPIIRCYIIHVISFSSQGADKIRIMYVQAFLTEEQLYCQAII